MSYEKIPCIYASVTVFDAKGGTKDLELCILISEKKIKQAVRKIVEFKKKFGCGKQSGSKTKRLGFVLRSSVVDKQGQRDLIHDTHPHACFLG